MKALFIFLVLSSINAYACPNLSGKYSCTLVQTGASGELLIEQTTVGNIDTFHIVVGDEDTDYLADGEIKDVSSYLYTSQIRVWCENDLLKTWAQSERNDEYYMSVTDTVWSKDSTKLNISWHVHEKGKYNREYTQTWNCITTRQSH